MRTFCVRKTTTSPEQKTPMRHLLSEKRISYRERVVQNDRWHAWHSLQKCAWPSKLYHNFTWYCSSIYSILQSEKIPNKMPFWKNGVQIREINSIRILTAPTYMGTFKEAVLQWSEDYREKFYKHIRISHNPFPDASKYTQKFRSADSWVK